MLHVLSYLFRFGRRVEVVDLQLRCACEGKHHLLSNLIRVEGRVIGRVMGRVRERGRKRVRGKGRNKDGGRDKEREGEREGG